MKCSKNEPKILWFIKSKNEFGPGYFGPYLNKPTNDAIPYLLTKITQEEVEKIKENEK